MNTKIILSAFICILGFTSFAQASPTNHQSQNNAQKHQQVCKGKAEGTSVSYAANGVLWNGSCEQRFYPAKSNAVKGDEKELSSICQTDPKAKSINIEGKDINGHCALGFTSPQPK